MATHITLDRVKIKSDINHLLDTQAHFIYDTNPRTGDINGMYYSSKNDLAVPYNLYIATNKTKQTLTIEFSSKILKDDYPQLITHDNLRQCLERINNLGICTIDVEAILCKGCITSMDVTKDVNLVLTDRLLDAFNNQVGNYRRYKWTHYSGKGITFTRDVSSPDCKEEIKVYNKGKEILKPDNQPFLKSLEDPQRLINYFQGKTRFEISLPTARKIRSFLGISENYIDNVMNSNCNPIQKMFDRVLGNTSQSPITRSDNFEDFSMECVLIVYENNLKKIEMRIRPCYSDSKAKRNRMKKLENLLRRKQNNGSSNPIAEVRKLLE